MTDETRQSPAESVSYPKPETCPTCRRFTLTGLQQLSLHHRAAPISGIDLTRPLEVVFEEVRGDIRNARGKLFDVRMGFTGWADQVREIEGLLTCGLIALHHLKEQAKEHRQLWEKRDAEQLNTSQRPEGK